MKASTISVQKGMHSVLIRKWISRPCTHTPTFFQLSFLLVFFVWALEKTEHLPFKILQNCVI